jgi:hypothetical protein
MTGSHTDRQMTLTLDTGHPCVLSSKPTLRDGVLSLVRLVRDPAFLSLRVLPLLKQANLGRDWYVAHRHDFPDRTHSLQVFVWPPGSKTKIHDHSSWGVFCCAAGSLFEERYARLDEELKPNHAHLRRIWRKTWKERDGISTVLPYDGGIHRVGNSTDEPAVSVHLYGPRMGEIDGRDYDPYRDYVCDRRED